jgi:hypothetical protein
MIYAPCSLYGEAVVTDMLQVSMSSVHVPMDFHLSYLGGLGWLRRRQPVPYYMTI